MTDAITTLQQLLEEESLDRSGERVVCRWCRADAATDHSLSHDSDCEWWDFAQEVLALARAVAQAAREEEREGCAHALEVKAIECWLLAGNPECPNEERERLTSLRTMLNGFAEALRSRAAVQSAAEGEGGER